LPVPTDIFAQLHAIIPEAYGYGSGHIKGANFAFSDGSVRFISNTINNAATVSSSYNWGSISLLGALCTRDGGEVVNDAQY
jgi:prepilin-type processing-associated H-X9-DG protein